MTKKKKITFSVITAIVLAPIVFYASAYTVMYVSELFENPFYRPMVCYNQTVFYEEEITETETYRLEFLGVITSVAPASEKPDEQFECNAEGWLHSKLYKDINGTFYLEIPNGTVLKLKGSPLYPYPESTVYQKTSEQRK